MRVGTRGNKRIDDLNLAAKTRESGRENFSNMPESKNGDRLIFQETSIPLPFFIPVEVLRKFREALEETRQGVFRHRLSSDLVANEERDIFPDRVIIGKIIVTGIRVKDERGLLQKGTWEFSQKGMGIGDQNRFTIRVEIFRICVRNSQSFQSLFFPSSEVFSLIRRGVSANDLNSFHTLQN